MVCLYSTKISLLRTQLTVLLFPLLEECNSRVERHYVCVLQYCTTTIPNGFPLSTPYIKIFKASFSNFIPIQPAIRLVCTQGHTASSNPIITFSLSISISISISKHTPTTTTYSKIAIPSISARIPNQISRPNLRCFSQPKKGDQSPKHGSPSRSGLTKRLWPRAGIILASPINPISCHPIDSNGVHAPPETMFHVGPLRQLGCRSFNCPLLYCMYVRCMLPEAHTDHNANL